MIIYTNIFAITTKRVDIVVMKDKNVGGGVKRGGRYI
jgi:hypothetical protein